MVAIDLAFYASEQLLEAACGEGSLALPSTPA
jgi:hypothetical protein